MIINYFKILAIAGCLLGANFNSAKAQCNVNTAPPTTYGCSFGDRIDFFSINGISSGVSAGCSGGALGYLNTSAVTWTIVSGASTTFSANVGSGSTPQGFGIWIDLNKNGVYEHATENMFNNNPFLVHANTFTIPTSIASGTYNLRARCAYSTTQASACDNIGGGEAEDYVIKILGPGAALNFDGVNDFVNVPNNSSFSFGTNDFTLETWAKTTMLTGNAVMIGKIFGPNNYWFGVASGKANFSLIGGTDATGTTTISDGNWHHLAAVRKSGVVSLYVDGVLEATQINTGNATISNDLTIGNFGGTGFHYAGSLDEIRVWNRGLCRGELLNNKNGELTLPQTGLVAYYKFNQGIDNSNNSTVTTLTDLSTFANNGTLNSFTLNGATSNWFAPGAVISGSTVPVFVSPTIAVAGPSSVCNGSSITLTASGVSSYTWTAGPTTATNVVSPTTNTTYSVVGTNSLGCVSNMATKSITVNALPTISVTSGAICSGSSFTMVPSGASTYTFSSGSAVVSPTSTSSYSVTGTNAAGCVNSPATVATITVNANPTITVNSGVIISGSSFTLTPSGGISYTYSPSGPIVSPTITTTYTVIGSNASGCLASVISTVSINGAALNFDGVNDFVNVGNALNTTLSASNKITVEAWVKPSTNTGLGVIVGNYCTSPATNMQYMLRRDGNVYSFWTNNGSGFTNVNSVATVTTGVWQHVAGTWDGVSLKIYVNGVLSGTTAYAGTNFISLTNQTWIGGNSISELFNGSIDETRIWNRTLCQTEIQNNMNGEIATTGTNLIANYHFNQGLYGAANPTVTTLIDASASAYTGTLTSIALTGTVSNWVAPGAVTSGSTVTAFVSPTVAITGVSSICSGSSTTLTASGSVSSYTWTAGPTTATNVVSPTSNTTYSVVGTNTLGCVSNMAIQTVTVNICSVAEALNFDGVNDYVNLGSGINPQFNGTNKITLEAWVKPTTNTGYGSIVSNYATLGTGVQFILRRDANNYTFFTNNGSLIAVTSIATVTLNTWTHIAGTWDGTTMRIYVNGLPSGTASASGNFASSTNQVWIGGETAALGEYFNGSIDEVRIWKRTLCQTEIQNNMNGEIATTGTNLIANYHFNQGVNAAPNPTVTTLTDASGSAYTGTLTNIALTGTVSNWVAPGAVTSGSNVTAYVGPTVAITGVSSICSGSSTTLTASGSVSSYTWTAGPTTATNVVSPTANTTYSVVGTNTLGCVSNMAIKTVTVNALPTVSVTSGAICTGSSYTMVPTGASTYTFSSGSAVVSPTSTSSYSVTGTSTAGCVSSPATVATITVNALPTVTASTSNTIICTGATATITPAGAASYTLFPGGTTGTSFSVNPTSTITYTVYGTNASGCSNVTTLTQNVSTCTDINNLTLSTNEFNIYPNPSVGIFNVDVTATSVITIYNALGAIVLNSNLETGSHQLDLTNQTSGVYFAKIISNGKAQTVRLIKN